MANGNLNNVIHELMKLLLCGTTDGSIYIYRYARVCRGKYFKRLNDMKRFGVLLYFLYLLLFLLLSFETNFSKNWNDM